MAERTHFSSNNSPMQQQQHLAGSGSNSVDTGNSHSSVKHRQQQQEQEKRMKNMPSMSPAVDVFFDAGLMHNSSTVFPIHNVMPIPVATASTVSILGSGLSLRNGSTARKSGSSRILFLRLEQAHEQFRQLEKERKKCEAGLAAHFPGKKVTSANNIPIPRLQGSPSRVDRLIIDHFREHARVITLIAKVS